MTETESSVSSFQVASIWATIPINRKTGDNRFLFLICLSNAPAHAPFEHLLLKKQSTLTVSSLSTDQAYKLLVHKRLIRITALEGLLNKHNSNLAMLDTNGTEQDSSLLHDN